MCKGDYNANFTQLYSDVHVEKDYMCKGDYNANFMQFLQQCICLNWAIRKCQKTDEFIHIPFKAALICNFITSIELIYFWVVQI